MKSIDYLKDDYHNGRHWALNDRSQVVVDIFKKYVSKHDSILELGCSSGRNLVALHNEGYKNLTGLEMYPIKELPEFKLIRERYEEYEHKTYDVIFSASFLQEFESFPQELFNKTLSKCRKYFMIFGDLMPQFQHNGFVEVERLQPLASYSQPIIILKNERFTK